MKFGLLYSNWWPYTFDIIKTGALLGEKLEYDSFFVTDHFMNPYGEKMNLRDDTVEAWTLLAYLSSVTSRIKLGTCVTPLPLRGPGAMAKLTSALDNLSEGRLIFGVGAGWIRKEFEAFSEWDEPATRVDKTKEGLELMGELWSGNHVDFKGKYYRANQATILPSPMQKPHPPVWVGSISSKRMQTLAAQYGDAWIPWSLTVDAYREGVRRIKKEAAAAGRGGKVTFALASPVVPDDWELKELKLTHRQPPNLTVKRCPRFIEEYARTGLEYFVPNFYPPERAPELTKQFAGSVMNSF